MTKFFREFLNNESGAAAAEYALILAIVGSTIVAGALTLGNAIGTEMTEAATVVGGSVTP